MSTILVDMDGVIATEERTFERSLARPIPGAREALQGLAEAGHTIVIYSARSWSELRMTQRWLDENQITYHGIHLGKPVADRIIDDRAIRFENWDSALTALRIERESSVSVVEAGLRRMVSDEARHYLEALANRTDLLGPVLEVLRPEDPRAASSSEEERPGDSRILFEAKGLGYGSIGDLAAGAAALPAGSVGTIVLLHGLEQSEMLFDVPSILHRVLVPGGRAFIFTRWQDGGAAEGECWRISADGCRALFSTLFQIEQIETIGAPHRPDVAVKCIIRKQTD